MTAKTAPSGTWAYFDTSALVKRYVNEPGRRDVLRLMRRHACVTSVLAPVELRSAIRRRVADRALDAARVPAILRRLVADRDYWTLVGVGKEVLADAEGLVGTHPVRTLDAIHIASARLFASRLPESVLTFISADQRQTDAAAAGGLAVQRIGERT